MRPRLHVLEETGMDFMLKPRRATGSRQRVPMSLQEASGCGLIAGWWMDLVRNAPGPFTLHARNPERNIGIGGAIIAFAQVASAPYCSDKDNGRRTGTQEDYRNLIKTGAILRHHSHDRRLPGGADGSACLGAPP
jgi:trimethylamine--corrinoid protein Co-methyltransferase